MATRDVTADWQGASVQVSPETEYRRVQPRKPKAVTHAASSLSGALLEQNSSIYLSDDELVPEGGGSMSSAARFRLAVRWVLLLTAAVAIVGILGTALVFCYDDGIRLDTFLSGDKTDAERKELLDNYNAASGTLVSAVLLPIQILTSMCLAVACLCFASDWVLRRGVNDSIFRFMNATAAGAVMFLLSNGLSALNVQVTNGDTIVRITSEDLAASSSTIDGQPVAVNGSLITTWNASFDEDSAGNSVFNTILRTKLISYEDVQPTCGNFQGGMNWPLDTPLLSFGFKSQEWHLDTLQTALVPEQEMEITLDSTDLPEDSALPMSVGNATYLMLAATQVLPELLETVWSVPPIGYDTFRAAIDAEYSGIAGEDPRYSAASLLGISSTDFVSTSTPLLREMLANSSNISVDDVAMAYRSFTLSDSVVFDALTLEIPTIQIEEVDSDPTASYSDDCNSEGCFAWRYFGKDTFNIQPVVYAAAICLDADGKEQLNVDYFLFADIEPDACPQRSNTSILLIGLGKRITGDTWDYAEDFPYGDLVQMNDINMVYSVTVGRLSWEIEDMANVFSAQCDVASGCSGVYAALDLSQPTANDVIVAGLEALPFDRLDYFSITRMLRGPPMRWTSLVSLSAHMDFTVEELLFPRRFTTITEAGGALRNTTIDCSQFIDKYIKGVEKNHLYAERSLQMTYTAGFFFLFENAVQHTRLVDQSESLAFTGNRQRLHVQASIPAINVAVSASGCVMVLALAIGVAVVHKRSAAAIERGASAEVIAEAMLNSVKYPPAFLKMSLSDANTPALKLQEEPLQNMKIQDAVFVRKQVDV
jgi:hypothetical protein